MKYLKHHIIKHKVVFPSRIFADIEKTLKPLYSALLHRIFPPSFLRFLPLFLLISASLYPLNTVQAQAPTQLNLHQVRVDLPDIHAYISVQDADQKFVPNLSKSAFSGSVAQHDLQVSDIKQVAKDTPTAYIFVLDMQKSLSKEVFEKVRSALLTWIHELSFQDRAVVISFGDSLWVRSDLTNNKNALIDHIQSLAAQDHHASLYQALDKALDFRFRTDLDLPERRVVVLLSNGMDESPREYSYEGVLRTLSVNPLPIFALGLADQEVSTDQAKSLEKIAFLARASGGAYYETNQDSLPKMFMDIKNRLESVSLLHLTCPDCTPNNQPEFLKLQYKDGQIGLTKGIDIRMDSKLKDGESYMSNYLNIIPYRKKYKWILPLSLLFVGAISTWWWLRRPRKIHFRKEPDTRTPEFSNGNVQPALQIEAATAKPAPINIQLAVIEGVKQGKIARLKVTKSLILGRNTEALPFLAKDSAISSQHALLIPTTEWLMIEDLGSTNKTFVNGVPIQDKMYLRNDDIIRIGTTMMRINYLLNDRPMISEPVTSEPVTSEPITSEPVTSESVISDPTTLK
jgi:hypothetical protein